jgi:hypothetical protein
MEEPIHHDQQHDDREQSRAGLYIKSVDALRQIIHNACSNKPSDERGQETDSHPGRYRTAVCFLRLHHTGGDSGENQDAFQTLPKDHYTDIRDSGE